MSAESFDTSLVPEETVEYLALLESQLMRANEIIKDVAQAKIGKRLTEAKISPDAVIRARNYLEVNK